MRKNGVRTLLKLRIPSVTLKNEYANRYLDKLVDRVKNGVVEKKKDGSIKNSYVLSDAAKDILLPGWNTTTPNKTILQH